MFALWGSSGHWRSPCFFILAAIALTSPLGNRTAGQDAKTGEEQKPQPPQGQHGETENQAQQKLKHVDPFEGLKGTTLSCQGLSTTTAGALELGDGQPRIGDFPLRAEFVSTNEAQTLKIAMPSYCKDAKPGPSALGCQQIGFMIERLETAHTTVKIDGRTFRLLGPRIPAGIYPARFSTSEQDSARQGAAATKPVPCLPPLLPPGGSASEIDVIMQDVNRASRAVHIWIWSPPPATRPGAASPPKPDAR